MLCSVAIYCLLQAQTLVSPVDPRVHYVGRFDTRDASGPRCEWSASTVVLKVRGSELLVKAKTTGQDSLATEVDGKPAGQINLKSTEDSYTVNLGPGVHVVRLVKRTEAFVGIVQFLGFSTPGGELLPAPVSQKHLEIIGDSISCAYGNEGKSKEEHFKPETENAYLAYGPVAARAVGAECSVIAWSGRKMWPDNTMPEIYDLALPTDPSSIWAFKAAPANAIVINLATNDFGRATPDEAQWTEAYRLFIARLRKHHPHAVIYCAIGSMMGGDGLTTLRGYLRRMVEKINGEGDTRVKVLEFAQQDMADGIGSDWHPSVLTHAKMAKVLAGALHRDLGW